MILTGIGVGLTLATMMATAASSLSPQSFATGSAVINMIRQTGLALGVAVLIAVLDSPTGHGRAALYAFRHSRVGSLPPSPSSASFPPLPFSATAQRPPPRPEPLDTIEEKMLTRGPEFRRKILGENAAQPYCL
jgi:hypothetical protein